MTECNRCGDCCRAIGISSSKKQLKENNALDNDFLLKHWHRISRAEAEHRLPGIKEWPKKWFYECDMFDKKNNICLAGDKKPHVCTGFPWYGRDPLDELPGTGLDPGVWARCEYFADIPQEYRPIGWQPVLLTTKPI